LALCQARAVALRLLQSTGTDSELVIVETRGDLDQKSDLASAGSIGLFTSEVQRHLLEGRADYAVHSLKDLPAIQVSGLVRACVPERRTSADVLLVRPEALEPSDGPLPLASGAVVGTASARRKAFTLGYRPDLEIRLLRGNVPTRVQQLRESRYDAILLARAGLERLGLDSSGLREVALATVLWPGAPGQGALAIECRDHEPEILAALRRLHDPAAAELVEAERLLLRALGGGCGLPLGASARRDGGELRMNALLGPTSARPDAPPLARADVRGATPGIVASAARAALLRQSQELPR